MHGIHVVWNGCCGAVLRDYGYGAGALSNMHDFTVTLSRDARLFDSSGPLLRSSTATSGMLV